jgi:hypothetical protein
LSWLGEFEKSAPVGIQPTTRPQRIQTPQRSEIWFRLDGSVTHNGAMRTTVNLDDDVAREVAKLRLERGIGLSAAVNELVRAGLEVARQEFRYQHVSHYMGALVDLSNVAEVLELLDEDDRSPGSAS